MKRLLLGIACCIPMIVSAQSADSYIDRAIVFMGGDSALRSLERVRLEWMTSWNRTSFDPHPFADAGSYELDFDLRDYTNQAWRNTRRSGVINATRDLTDIVVGEVAIRRFSPTSPYQPLNIAYVDERKEVFAMMPERLLLGVRTANDRKLLSDTAIAGRPHARVSATALGFPFVLYFRKSDGLLTMARYRAAQPNDFGLAGWGAMDVEVWYGRWGQNQSGIAYPAQFDIVRVRRPYKRLTLLRAVWNPPASPDSFAISDSLRSEYLAKGTKAMHDLPLDSARAVSEYLVEFRTPGLPFGAIRVGKGWVLLEGASSQLSAERSVAWLKSHNMGSATHVIASTANTGSTGGTPWYAMHGVEIVAGAGAAEFVAQMLRVNGVRQPRPTAVVTPRWIRSDGDSLLVESLDLPDFPGSLVLYSPSRKWVFSTLAAAPLHRRLVMEYVRKRGWVVTSLGTGAGLAQPITP